ncbi:MAG: hypothetical protein IJB48_01160, partial [Clostridia bacterium]|nr:hypothetical protein [Clostridia bacterium]
MKTTGTTQVKRCLTTLLAVLMLISLIPMASVSVSATTTVTYAESFSALTNDQIVNGSTVTMANGATLTFSKSSLGTHTLGVEGGILKATSIGTADSSNYGWSVTYTLPEAVYGDVIVDFDWRMGRELADGSIVAMGTNGDHYSTKQVEIYDDSETAKSITVWDFHKTDRAYVNGRDNQPTCVICDTQMAKWSGNVTANFSYSEMKTLRTIIDTTEKTVEGGSLDDGGNYVHLQNQFGHSGAHNVVLTQLTDDCGGVKSIKFDMWGDGGVGDGVKTVVWLDNIVVSNSPAATTAETPVRFYKESFSSLAASDITAGNTVTMPNGATLKFANTNTSGATLTLAGGALKATSNADDKGWTMTYTLPKAVYGSVIVDFDFRMGIISGEKEVALSEGSHYSNNRFLINDENGNKMSAWGFNRMANAFINNRDQNPAQSCQTCETQLTNSSWAATTTFTHDTMTTLRAILDTDADTVEGGSVNADGTYVYNTTRSGHTAAHNVVLPQLTTGCGGVKSITFNLYSQGSAG